MEKLLRPTQPATDRRHQSGIEEQVHRDANCRARRADRVAGMEKPGVRAFPRLDRHIEMTCPVGDIAKNSEIGEAQEVIRVCLHEQVEGLRQVSAGSGRMGAPKQITTDAVAHRAPPLPRHGKSPEGAVEIVTVRVTAVTVLLTQLQ
ncbi:MAG TPA: hypothetical protein VIU11_08015 [Nakamurella sp.]